MTPKDDASFQAIWQGQAPPTLRMSIEQLRERAREFEMQVHRRYLRDRVSSGLVLLIFACYVIFVSNPLIRLGSAMTIAWAAYSLWALRRYGSVLSAPDASEQTCSAYHRLQLERQRDIALSWPWGVGLAMPGLILVSTGLALAAEPPKWPIAFAMIGVFMFVYLAVVIHGKRMASEWQREIESL